MPTTEEQLDDLISSVNALVSASNIKKSQLDAAVLAAQVSNFKWTGQWATATDYYQGDAFEESGNAYVTLEDHTSGTFATDLAANKMELVVSKGDAGPTGATGADGADGNTILTGTGAPGGGTGNDGDIYIDTAASDLYGPKAGGAWGSATSLVGADGADGTSVPTGGTVGQVLKKASGTDYDFVWDDPATVANWASVTGTPTTLAGYGITDAYTEAEVDALLGAKADASDVLTPVPAGAVFTDTVYSHPATHSIAEVAGLQTALNGKANAADVLTPVPAGALFTDTIYTHPATHEIAEVNGLQAALDAKLDGAHDHDGVYLLVGDTAVNSALLNGQSASYYQAWSNLTGVPATFPAASHSHPEYLPVAGGTVAGALKALRYHKTVVNVANGTSINLNNGNVFYAAPSANKTYTFNNPPASGTAVSFTLEVTPSAAITITWPAAVQWVGRASAPPAPGSGEKGVYTFFTRDGGATWLGIVEGGGDEESAFEFNYLYFGDGAYGSVSSHSFTGVDLGSESVFRHIVVGVDTNTSEAWKSIADVKLNGQSLTKIAGVSEAFRDVEIWQGWVPVGATGDIEVVHNSGVGSTGTRIMVGSIYGAFKVHDSVAAGSRSVTGLDAPAGSIVLSVWGEQQISVATEVGQVTSAPSGVSALTDNEGTTQAGMAALNNAAADTYDISVTWPSDTSSYRPGHVAVALTEN